MSDQVKLKLCNSCGEEKPATPEHFHRHARYGFQSECKSCLNLKNLERYREDPEARRAENRSRYWRKQGKKPPAKGAPRARKPAETPLELAIEAFLLSRGNLSASTGRNYKTTLLSFAESYPNFPPTGAAVVDYITTRRFKASSKRSKFACFRAFTMWLKTTGRIDHDPLEGVIRPPKEELLPRAARQVDIEKVFGYLERQVEEALSLSASEGYQAARDLAAFSLMLDSGLRVGEVVGLDISDIDLEEGSALIRNSKTNRERYVIFGKKVKGNLKLWLKVRSALGIPDRITALFVSGWGGWKRCRTSTFRKALVEYCQTAGAGRFSCHQLRHACASLSISNGVDPERLRQQLGHRDIAMTARYFRMPNEGRRKVHLRTSPLDNLGRAA